MKKILPLICLLLLLPAAALGETIVASFFPVYLFARNLTVGIDALEMHCLAAPGTGCLHDYQLTSADMKALSKADLFLINGAGMESYLDFVFSAMPDLPIVDACRDIPLIEDEDEDESNAHVWLNPVYAMQMVNNLADGLMDTYPAYAAAIAANRDAYTERLTALHTELTEGLAPLRGQALVTFHEAFPYFAQAYGLEIAAVITHDADDALSAYQLRQLIALVQELDVPPLFTEPQYDDLVAQTIANETGAVIEILDPCATGPQDETLPLTLYEDTLRADMQTLLRAFGKE